VERNINILIDHQCPQCGGPATLQETDRLFACKFCQVTSYLLTDRYFKYLIPHNGSNQEQIFYFPYWRFKGMLFSVSPLGIKDRFVDISHQAIGSRHMPISLGLRSQTLKLKFVTPKSEGVFLKPIHSSKQVMDLLDERFLKDLPKPVLHKDHIGENLSLIFAPFYLKENKIFDAILNQPVSAQLPDDYQLKNFNSGPAEAHLKFLPMLCPDCGWDLWGQRDSLILFCKNCESVWYSGHQQLQKIQTAFLATESSHTLYLPFWRIRARVSGISLSSYADFIRIANLPKVVQPQWENEPFRFWGPAFKVRPQRYLKLATGITISQPTQELTHGMPKTDQLVSMNLSLTEALETLKLNLASLIRPRQLMVDSIQAIRIESKSYLLVYLPFEVSSHEFIQPDINLAINKNQLSLASNL
jgi:ribosomal protein L37AE/L43A